MLLTSWNTGVPESGRLLRTPPWPGGPIRHLRCFVLVPVPLAPLPSLHLPPVGALLSGQRIRFGGSQTNFHFWTLHLHEDRKSTRLNSSHANISYAVFCLKKKKK